MTFGQSAPAVRTHRRGGKGSRRSKRRKLIAPWIIVTAVSVLVFSLLTTGFVMLIKGSCSGPPERISVVASSAISGSLKALARSWQDTEPSVDGQCVGVEVTEKDSAEVAQSLSPDWNTKTDGDAPDVWVPESSAWTRMAQDRGEATAKLIPDTQPSIARTSAVIAMPKTMAEAVGWPDAKLTWSELAEKAADDEGWAAEGHPEWGAFKVGMTNPLTSTAGMLSLLAIIDENADGTVTDTELQDVVRLKESMSEYTDDPGGLMAELSKADAENKALEYLSAFPALERDVLYYNKLGPNEPLVAVYPSDGTADADHPYLVLQNTPWGTPQKRDTAKQFLDYVRGDAGKQQFLADGFRDANRQGGPTVSEANGLSPQIAAPVRDVMAAGSVTNTVATWNALNRVTNLLFVVDTSAAMGAPATVDDEETTLLAAAQEALRTALGMIGDQSSVGLWEFAADPTTGQEWYQLTEMQELTPDSKSVLQFNIDALIAGGDSTLFDTTLAAFEHVTENYQPEAANMVVLLSAGPNQYTADGLDLTGLTERLTAETDPNKPVSIMTIGYGEQADADALRAISSATKGQYFDARLPAGIGTALLNALFNVQ